jgi:hypothetical protein
MRKAQEVSGVFGKNFVIFKNFAEAELKMVFHHLRELKKEKKKFLPC